MKHSLLTAILLMALPVLLRSQIIWSENFSAGSAARGTSAVGYPGSSGGNWSQTTNILGGGEGGSANQWYVSGEECGNAAGVCGSACPNGDASLHVSAIGGLCGTPDCGAAYDETSAANRTDKRIQSPNINTVGYGGLTLSFNYIAAQGDDDVTVVYSCNGGTTWNNLAPLGATSCCDCNDAFFCAFLGICCGGITACSGLGQGYWTTQNYALPACTENISNLRIGFHWFNNGNGIGTDPSIAIDDITITSSVPLAATLIAFDGEIKNSTVQLDWTTASEKDNDHFLIERRNEAGAFEVIGSVQGAGNSEEIKNYQWIDRQPNDGDNYYRLSMIDLNGERTFSPVIYIPFFTQFSLISVYPNPAEDRLHFVVQSTEEEEITISLVDIQGRAILTEPGLLNEGKNILSIDLDHVNSGRYVCQLEANGKVLRELVVIK